MGMGSKLCLDPRYVFILFISLILTVVFILVLYYKSRTTCNMEGEQQAGDDTGTKFGPQVCFILFNGQVLTILFVFSTLLQVYNHTQCKRRMMAG